MSDDLPDSELLEPYMTSGGETDMTDDQPDLLTELDAASHCPHGVDLDMNDDCDLCISDRSKAVVAERDGARHVLVEFLGIEEKLPQLRKVIAHAWQNNWGDEQCGVLILGTHDDKEAHEFAERMCVYWYGLHAADPVTGWYRDSFNDFGERAWVNDPVRGRAGVMFTAVEHEESRDGQ